MPRDAVIARSDVGVIGADHPLEGDPARQTLGRVYAAAYLSLPEERRSPVSIRAQECAGPDDLNLQHSVFRSEARARNLVDLFSEDTDPEQLAHPTSPSSCTMKMTS